VLDSLSKVISTADFEDPEIQEIIAEMYRHAWPEHAHTHWTGIPVVFDTKRWEHALAVAALRRHGALRDDSILLGVGAGTEVTSFYLARFARLVLASDIYLDSGPWKDVAPPEMLMDASTLSPFPVDRRSILGVHLDARAMNLPDDFVDGIFSSGSIEYFGGFEQVAAAASEIGRVLKPGGVASIATTFRLAGPGDVVSWGIETMLFTEADLRRHIIDSSGCELVGELLTEVDSDTLATRNQTVGFLGPIGRAGTLNARLKWCPNLVLAHQGFVFCTVNIVLRKPL